MIFIFLITIPAAIIFFATGWAAGYNRAKAPKPYVPPITYTVIGAKQWRILENMGFSDERFLHYESRITTLSSLGDVREHSYPRQRFNKKQIERIALENDWFYDEEVIKFEHIE